MEKPLIYLDHNATTIPTQEHLQLLFNKLQQSAGNPSSPHSRGRAASVALTEARLRVAKLIGVEPKDLIFVGSGSEANNCGTTGVLRHFGIPLQEQHVITSSIEHPSIREPLEYLQKTEGLQLTVLSVNAWGFVSLAELVESIRPQTTLISLMSANNEIGSLQPVKELGDFLHKMRWSANTEKSGEEVSTPLMLSPGVTRETLRKLHFHVDAIQSLGKIKTEKWFSDGIDSCSFSAHKIGGLQGIGALFLRQGRKFRPLILGGAQEKNRRAGTENLPGAISFGLAAHAALNGSWWDAIAQVESRRKMLYAELKKLEDIGVELNSPDENVLPNTVHFSVSNTDLSGEDLLVTLDLNGICASSGSACSSGANLPSKVVLALGKDVELAKNSVRLSLGTLNTDAEILKTVECIKAFVFRG